MYYKKWYLLYDGDDDNSSGNDEGQNNDSSSEGNDSDSSSGSSERTFNQDEVNKMLATERRKNEEKTKKVIGELETLKKSKNLTEKEQKDLSKRIEELQDQMLTKEQLAAKDKEKLEKDYSTQIDTLTGERDNWKKRFEDTLIINSIHKASEEAEAIDTGQIIALIQAQNPRVVQNLDDEGQPKDSFTPRVKMQEFDSKQNKQVTLDLTIAEAVKRMKDNPINFNLFKSTVSGGLGLDSGEGRSSSDTPPLTDPAAYRKWRKKNLT